MRKLICALLFLEFGTMFFMLSSSVAVPINPFPLDNPHPSRKPLSETKFSVARSSEVTVGYTGMQNVQLATGVIHFESAFVSSPGVNSVLIMRDSNKFSIGNSTFTLNPVGDNTNTYGTIPFQYQSSTQGIVYTSTCAVCTGAPWSPPRLRFSFERLR